MNTVLLTGASGSIGRAVAGRLLAAGYRVALAAHEHADRLAGLTERYPLLSRTYSTDLLAAGSGRELLARVERELGPVDILINNAGGVFGAKPFGALTAADLDQTLALNFHAAFWLSQELFNRLVAGFRPGKIIMVSSIAARYGGGETTLHYGCAKAALEGLVRGLARTGAQHGILVNAVQPGFIESEFHRKLGRDEAAQRARIAKIPLGRAGRPDEVAALVEFLCSERSAYITGQVISISGGD